MDDINIQNEDLIEFEFEKFSIFFDEVRQTWFLEAYEELFDIVLDDETLKEHKDKLDSIEFKEEELNNLKKFVEKSNENN